jgi:hypothetical protein
MEGIMAARPTYAIKIAGVERELRLFEIKPGLKIAILTSSGIQNSCKPVPAN